jgi:hypothetical protein
MSTIVGMTFNQNLFLNFDQLLSQLIDAHMDEDLGAEELIDLFSHIWLLTLANCFFVFGL